MICEFSVDTDTVAQQVTRGIKILKTILFMPFFLTSWLSHGVNFIEVFLLTCNFLPGSLEGIWSSSTGVDNVEVLIARS